MSAEDERTKESATALTKIVTSAYPEVNLAPWMSHYDKRTEAVIVGIRTIGDIAEEVDRRQWMTRNPSKKAAPSLADPDAPGFDASQARGGSGMVAFCLNRLASNMHNFAPSIDGMRTRQGIAWAKANNPGMATPTDEKKKSGWKFWQKEKKPE